jgi:colanic acid biosynthesis glycosyl transferase WcaI
MRILFVSDNFPPETNAPAVRTFEHARAWTREGHEVTVVTGAPNFPTGRVFEGYRNAFRSVERVDGIRVVRVWTYMTPNEGTVRRSLDFLSFMLTSIPAGLLERRPDVVVGTSPQLLTVAAAYVVARLRGAPVVFELRDLWPESIRAVGAAPAGPVLRMLTAVARFLYRHTDRIVAVTRSFVEILAEEGVPREKMAVVRNGVDLEEFAPAARDNAFRRGLGVEADEFLVTYVGTIGMAHGLATLLDAAERTRGERVRYLVVGEGAERASMVRSVEERRLGSVSFLRGQARETVPSILAASDAVVVPLRSDPLFSTVIPSKIFEAMGTARPIILGVKGESARIVAEADAGIVVEPESVEDLVGAIRRLKDDPALAAALGRNGRRAAEASYSRHAAAMRMLDLLLETAGTTSSRPRRPSPDSPGAAPPERPSSLSPGSRTRSSAPARRA